jgi:hypothetical protein
MPDDAGAPEDKFVAMVTAKVEVDLRLSEFAPCTALFLTGDMDLEEASTQLVGKVGMWLLNAPEKDVNGRIWNENAPIRSCANQHTLNRILHVPAIAARIRRCIS